MVLGDSYINLNQRLSSARNVKYLVLICLCWNSRICRVPIRLNKIHFTLRETSIQTGQMKRSVIICLAMNRRIYCVTIFIYPNKIRLTVADRSAESNPSLTM